MWGRKRNDSSEVVRSYVIKNPGRRIDLRKLREFTELESLSVVGSDYFLSIEGVLFSKDRKSLLFYPVGKKDESYHVPEGTETIGIRAFQDARYLKKVTMASTVSCICGGAFYGCKTLESVVMSDAITEIQGITELMHDGVFEGCDNLRTVIFSKNLKYIGACAFLKCGRLVVDIPDGVECIGDYAFAAYKTLQSQHHSYFSVRDEHVPSEREECVIPPSVRWLGKGALAGMQHVIAHEGTARGLICAIEATYPFEKSTACSKMLWMASRISMIGRDGVTRQIRIPRILSEEARRHLDMAWNQASFDFGTYALCLDGIGDSQEKQAFALDLYRLDVGDDTSGAYLRRVAPGMARRCINERREDDLVALVQYQFLTPATLKKVLARCNEEKLSVAAAYILETLHTTKMPRASLRL